MPSIFAVIPLLRENSDAINKSNLRNFSAYITIKILLNQRTPHAPLPFLPEFVRSDNAVNKSGDELTITFRADRVPAR